MNKTSATGFPGPTPLSTRLMTSKLQDCLRLSGRDKGTIGLCSKTYYCFVAKDKFSCKGVNKRCNEINKDKHLKAVVRENWAGVTDGGRPISFIF